MTHLLLTGAGFSRNWGGWLADEAFEYLIGCPEINEQIRTELWKSKNSGYGFENTLNELRQLVQRHGGEPFTTNLRTFEAMLESMFNTMNNAFKNTELNPLHNPSLMGGQVDLVRHFLAHFDAIFTLNQDALLELKYNVPNAVRDLSDGARWRDMYSPGLVAKNVQGTPYGPPGLYEVGNSDFKLEPSRQPYFKLHGSSNWRDGDSMLLVMGGNKGTDTDNHPLLRNYKARFTEALSKSDTKLVIIGYSFLDPHINEIIACGAAHGAKFFIVDIRGVDVLDNAAPLGNLSNPISFKDNIFRCIEGGSRRNLISTFASDRVEYAKIMRFLTRLAPSTLTA